jgi:hypothetical protein
LRAVRYLCFESADHRKRLPGVHGGVRSGVVSEFQAQASFRRLPALLQRGFDCSPWWSQIYLRSSVGRTFIEQL